MKKLLSLVLALALTLSVGSVALANSDPAMQEIIFALQNEPTASTPASPTTPSPPPSWLTASRAW